MELNKFLESEKTSKEFIEDAVVSSVVTNATDKPENPVRHPLQKIDKAEEK